MCHVIIGNDCCVYTKLPESWNSVRVPYLDTSSRNYGDRFCLVSSSVMKHVACIIL